MIEGRSRDSVLIGVGAALMLVVLLVAAQSSAISGVLGARTSTTIDTAALEYAQVSSAYDNHLLTFGAVNVPGLLSDYTPDATIEWTSATAVGATLGLEGNFTGTIQITQMLDNFPGGMKNLTMSDESQPNIVAHGESWTASSSFAWAGFNSRYGSMNGRLSVQATYVDTGYGWSISNETWTTQYFDCSLPDC